MKIKKYIVLAAAIFYLCSLTMPVSAETTGSTNAEITFESGTLTLAEMSSFSFGTHTISPVSQTYPALESSVFLDVQDLRGTGEGWKVTALASRFNPGANPTLPGTSISLINGTAVPAQPIGMGNVPSVGQNIKMDCDGIASVNIASAEVNNGLGVWTVEWNGNAGDNTNATLNVLGGVATVGTHTATITWTLTDAP